MVTARPLGYEFPTWGLPTQPSDFKKRLINLISIMNTIGGSEINSITGLFIRIFADEKELHQYQLAIMLEKILYWLSRMKKLDYEIYRTDEEWMGDIGLSRYKLRKMREILDPVVISQNKHNWSRTKIMHYQLNGEALLERIAKVYGKSESFVRGVLFIRSIENPDFKPSRPSTLKPDFKGSGTSTSKSLTTLPSNLSSKEERTLTTTTHAAAVEEISLTDKKLLGFPEQYTDDSEQVDRLVKIGVWRKVAKNYQWIPIETLQTMIDQAQEKQKSGQIRGSFPNYLAGVLKKYAETIREEFQRTLAHNPDTTFENFLIQHEQHQPAQSTSDFANMTWSDFADNPEAFDAYKRKWNANEYSSQHNWVDPTTD